MALESRAGAARRRTNAPAGPRARLQRQRFPQVSSARRRASFLAVGFRVETFGKAELETSCPSVNLELLSFFLSFFPNCEPFHIASLLQKSTCFLEIQIVIDKTNITYMNLNV